MNIWLECFKVTARHELSRISNDLREAETDEEKQNALKRLQSLGVAMAKQLVTEENEEK